MGFIPNMDANMANVPAVLSTYLHGYGLFRKESGFQPAEQEVVFLAINKTGSSSLWTWMDEHKVPYLMNRYREDEARKLRIIAEVKHNHLPCFTVVRNPWSRAVSSWMRQISRASCSTQPGCG